MSLAPAPSRTARVCDVCSSWPCTCHREPKVHVYVEPTIRVETCVCGGNIVVYDLATRTVTQTVAAHNVSLSHTLWRRWVEA